ncbi:recombinase family protein [Cryptosporangium minutisporangium]|uniref:Resolvase/invertase-type recombinase catalytic domain-containing protein n=1 Tax=Cryptosporangium minutisporangium TaxID=113569 RepID=A0ABP6T7Y4_9ACTN
MTAGVRELSPAESHGAGRHGFAAPVTLPATPTAPTAWPPPLVVAPEEHPDATRLLAALDRASPVRQPEPEPPRSEVSRVVVGYLRATSAPSDPLVALARKTDDLDDDVTAPLVAAIAQYARERGLTLLRVHRDDVTDDDARRPGFSACLRHLYLREASAIVVPTWDHLAPNDVLRRALCHNATSAGGTIQVIDPTAG